ncbi:serine/threonine-protein kinase TBK1-like isoform X1 [Dreissena polymorpha]|uniref:serine/threonine-protein kinase TBK1-like isoform X1 n=1 Tax=Dreissena polymorpha TaxID=45954 RepID=UPI0022640B15|nr:serine/threonine-protein kinase TBK1-like isoform X1 [Dreissena polymorpha]XP_052285628.1 serine/threonine-protein kinase TBK1-like isoform X1 [Dreissena polymorpha]XP_052285629.1 serine/threonine-protein kinase TBK1-like isoform X1 [Dreissena polymorpha]
MNTLRGSSHYLWDVSKPLGQGATSMVYKGRNKSSGEEVAVKVFSRAAQMRPHEVQMREFDVMRKLAHRNIVPLLDAEEEQGTGNKVIVMQLTEHGSLFNVLEEPHNAYGLPEEEFLIVLEHVTCGVKYMREHGIIHRDIKPGNILRYIGEDGRSVYKLTDFGSAKQVQDEEEPFMSLYGTEEYLHPDMYEKALLRAPDKKHFTSKVDLWSLGVTFFHVATGELPFKPFGGRNNREKMFEITTRKESGVIMGVQHIEMGPIQWSKELPGYCRLSAGLKLLITPVFARLLESNPKYTWNFDDFFDHVANIIKKRVIHVFCPHTWTCLKVYIDAENNLTNLQELIAKQTDIQSTSQLLIFDGQLLKDCVQPLLPVCNYPEGITETNPIFCFDRDFKDTPLFPPPPIREFPKTKASSYAEDYKAAKACSATGCYMEKEVEWYSIKQDLVRRSVQVYIHELYHECSHLADYNKFRSKNCDNLTQWKETFLQMFQHELRMIKVLTDTQDSDIGALLRELNQFYEECVRDVNETSRKITELSYEVENELKRLQDDHLNKKILKKKWNDSVGCSSKDRCVQKVHVIVTQIVCCSVQKVHVIVTQILKTKQQFGEDRRKTGATFNDEQIHKYEKHRLFENCIKIESLFSDHCQTKAKEQFQQFHVWYRQSWEIRYKSEQIEKLLLKLAELLENFVRSLSQMCLKYKGDFERCITRIEASLTRQERHQHPPSPLMQRSVSEIMMGSAGSRDELKRMRNILIRSVLQGLHDNQKVAGDLQQELHSQSEDLSQLFSSL